MKHKDFKKTLVHQKNLKNLVTSLFEKFQYNVPRRGLERFFAFFNTNRHGKINVSEIGDLVYKESEREFIMRAQMRLKGPPPVYFSEDLPVVDLDEEEQRLKK